MALNQQNQNQVLNVPQINRDRAQVGLGPIHHVWCKICRESNRHYWWACPNVRCKICNQAHPTFSCNLMQICQWCGSHNHISELCTDQRGRILKAGNRRRCYRCGHFGHIAATCYSVRRGGYWRRRTWRARRWRRRRRRR